MFKAYVLIRNLESRAKHLNFGEFTIELIEVDYKKEAGKKIAHFFE